MTEPLADRLVMAAQNASEDCGCGPNESAIVVAVLRELAQPYQRGTGYPSINPAYSAITLTQLADEIEGGAP